MYCIQRPLPTYFGIYLQLKPYHLEIIAIACNCELYVFILPIVRSFNVTDFGINVTDFGINVTGFIINVTDFEINVTDLEASDPKFSPKLM